MDLDSESDKSMEAGNQIKLDKLLILVHSHGIMECRI